MMNAIGMILLTFPVGVLADRYGKVKFVILKQGVLALAVIMILISKSIEMFRLTFLLLGLNNGFGIVFQPFYSSLFDGQDMDKAFGLLGFLSILSTSIGSLFGFIPPVLVERYGFGLQGSYWTMLLISAVFWLTIIPFTILMVRGVVEPKTETEFKFNLRSKGVIAKFSILSLIQFIGLGSFLNFFPFYVNKKFGVESDNLGTLFFISNFVAAGAQALAPKISKQLGSLKTIAVTLGLCTPFYLLIPLTPNFTGLSITYIIRLGISSISSPLITSLFMKLLHKNEKTIGNSVINMVVQGGNIVAPWLGSRLMEQVSLDFPALLGAGLYPFIAAFYYILLINEREKD
jgi:MFS family permease